MHALAGPLVSGWSHEELARHERRAWSSLPGCSELPVDPYTEAFLDATLTPPQQQPHRPLPRPADVLQAWRHTTLSGRLSRRRNSCADLLLVSLFEGEIAAVGCGNSSQGLLASKGTLAAYHEFKFVLHAAASAALPASHRAPNALFLLDLGDRANVNVYGPRRDGGDGSGGGGDGIGGIIGGGSGGGSGGSGGSGISGGSGGSHGADGAPPLYDQQPDETPLRVPKLTTSGGCGERWPVPFALKGFGSNTWQAIMREPALGGGDKWRWPPQVPWHAKRPEAHWRGASYSF